MGSATPIRSRRRLRYARCRNGSIGDAICLTISISAQGTERRDELTIADLPTLFFRARRFKVAVNFRGLRRSLSIPCRA
jgi:hypothetical protein